MACDDVVKRVEKMELVEVSEEKLNPLKLVSIDGHSFDVSDDFKHLSSVVAGVIEDCPGMESFPVRHDSASTEVLEAIVKYYGEYRGKIDVNVVSKEDLDKLKVKELSEWDAKLLERPYDEIYPLILIANFLGMTHFLDILCQKLADGFKGLTHIEMRERFNITNDLSPEEERQIMIENGWIEPTEEDKKKLEEMKTRSEASTCNGKEEEDEEDMEE